MKQSYVWSTIDAVITSPAWILGYFIQAYCNAFEHGKSCYEYIGLVNIDSR